ncbi:hypothetical protein TSUD_80490 [Trifolium subterraneum]|uniref:Uncharacterized protein n=1 Tax=Trifolium subterraneum TaxID=3900 RepID=A0A2Z6M1G2_TRISU|nr:hypothetical protein TSUD_80490 [Trifolium subterraneum]
MEVNENVSHEMIISFDSCNDVISKIEMPISSSKDYVEVYKKLVVYNYKDDSSVGVEYWVKVQTIGMFSPLDRPVGVWKNEVLMATKTRLHSVRGIVALLPEDDIGAEFSYNLLSYEESYAY